MDINRQIEANATAPRRLKAPRSIACVRAILLFIGCILCLEGCRIEPPLLLPDDLPYIRLAICEVKTDLDVIWNVQDDWRSRWWYGWDDEDTRLFGDLTYHEPNFFEGRFFYLGETQGNSTWIDFHKESIRGVTFRRRFEFGYHDMLLWSNIESADGTQVLIINENDLSNIFATTSSTRLSFELPSRSSLVYNNPEVFYSGKVNDIYVSRDTIDYDYFDYDRNAWVKEVPTTLYPLVYLYLVQVAVYNNNGRIVNITDKAAISSLADAVNVRSGHTSNNPSTVTYPMRMKTALKARDDREADIFGGKFTTFGLCDMEPWESSRTDNVYSGSRSDLTNHLFINFSFNNSTDSAYAFDITQQLQKQAHGGIVTIEIDADTLHIPKSNQNGSSFHPTIEPSDSIENEFIM